MYFKTMRNKVKKIVCSSLMIFSLFIRMTDGLVLADSTPTNLPKEKSSTLSSGNYIVNENINIEADPGKSGLIVAPNSEVTINIPRGITLHVKGGDAPANSTDPGGAGIEVPESSTLTITGYGSLDAIGGNAGNGSDGQKGNDGKTDKSTSWGLLFKSLQAIGGSGGLGGTGGGGAGAGIGGKGGKGGEKNSSNDSNSAIVEKSKEGQWINGVNGKNGADGLTGQNAGTIFIYKSINLSANGGSKGKDGGGTGTVANSKLQTESGYTAYAGGGGAGAGGHGGFEADDIGGGGGGGSSGPNGGNGGTAADSKEKIASDISMQGGYYDEKNIKKEPTTVTLDSITYSGGVVGDFGSDGQRGTYKQKPEMLDSNITVYEIPDQTYTGSEIKPEIVVKDGDFTLTEGIDYEVKYENNISVGKSAKATIISKNESFKSSTKTFNIKPKEIIEDMVEEIPRQAYKGTAIEPTIIVKNGDIKLNKGTDYTVEYQNNINEGTAHATITGKGNYTGSVTRDFGIGIKTLTEDMVQDIPNQVYTGSPIEPKITILDNDIVSDPKLTENQEYVVTYKNNTNVGEDAIAEITGIVGYTGTITKTFQIEKKEIVENMVDEIPRQAYKGGTAIEPTIVVKNGDITLNKDTDYTVEYQNNINEGTAHATITGKGNYSGSVERNFGIGIKNITESMIQDIPNQVYTGSPIEPKIIVLDNDIVSDPELTENKEYTVTYTGNTNVGKASAEITGVLGYTGNATKTFNIEPKEITGDMIENIPDQKYTGSDIKPEITIKNGEITLIKGTDCTVEYTNNVDKGVAQAKIKGKGNYKGEITKDFVIGIETEITVSASKIIYGQRLSDSKITGKFTIDGVEVKGQFSFLDPTIEPSRPENGSYYEKDYDYKFNSEDMKYQLKGTVPVKVEDWGNVQISNGIYNWVDKEGKTSAIINEGITWLREESYGSSSWYGIENPLVNGKHIFEPGSKFWVRWINKKDSDWSTYYNQLDEKYKNDVNSERLWIFLIGITDPNGNEYSNFGTDLPLYIKLGHDWNKENLRAVFIVNGKEDEFFDKNKVSYVNLDASSGSPVTGEFAKIILSHFSVYGLYDSKSITNEYDMDIRNDDTISKLDDLTESDNKYSGNNLNSSESKLSSLDNWNIYPNYNKKSNSDYFQGYQYKDTGNMLPNCFNEFLLLYYLYLLKKRKF